MTHDKSYVEKDYKVVGSRVKRPDGIDKVTGKARYGADECAWRASGSGAAFAASPRANP